MIETLTNAYVDRLEMKDGEEIKRKLKKQISKEGHMLYFLMY
jgi:hypothetical protein